jgi:hypothetical protein
MRHMMGRMRTSPWYYDNALPAAFGKAVGVAAIYYAAQYAVLGWLNGAASSLLMPERFWHILLMTLIVGVFFALAALLIGALPFILSILVARRFGIGSLAYYVGCGILTTVLFATAIASAIPRDIAGTDFVPSWWEHWRPWALRFIVPGMCAGIVVWLAYGRSLGMRRLS